MIRLLQIAAFGALVACATLWDNEATEPRFWKGNTHTHTLWSDGDGAPELVGQWYVDNGYNFVVLSDHDVLSNGERWFPITETGRLQISQVEKLRETYGERSVAMRTRNDGMGEEMRLATLAELRKRFELPGEFLFVTGEEISANFQNTPVHVNAMNIDEVIAPVAGDSVLDTIQRNIDAVIAQGERLKRPVLAHLNHPNFGWAATADDIARIRGERFFEVYNGHPAVENHGNTERPSTEQMWDIALTKRLTHLDLGLLYGIATDDAHSYHDFGQGFSNPGRGWIYVRAMSLEPGHLINAMHCGDFYASSGVILDDFVSDDERMVVEIRREPGVSYRTRFIGTRLEAPDTPGEVLFETLAVPAAYAFRGDELYVRAKVISSRAHPNPYAEGDVECAWVQPIIPPRR